MQASRQFLMRSLATGIRYAVDSFSFSSEGQGRLGSQGAGPRSKQQSTHGRGARRDERQLTQVSAKIYPGEGL